MKINHIQQPDEISCGPACLKMVFDYMEPGNKMSINLIRHLAETDYIKGTTLEDMLTVLKTCKINHESPVLFSKIDALSYLNVSLENNNPIILRTLTKGIKHWIVITDFDGTKYSVNDPWFGQIEYTQQEILDIWRPRNFNCISILNNERYNELIIRNFKDEDEIQVMSLMINEFSKFMSESEIVEYTKSITNFNKSIVVDLAGVIIGFYLIGDRQISEVFKEENPVIFHEDISTYKDKLGVEGVALFIEKSHRGKGFASKLKKYIKTLEVDYVFGFQFKKLNNLEQWLKCRNLVAENDELNITAEKF